MAYEYKTGTPFGQRQFSPPADWDCTDEKSEEMKSVLDFINQPPEKLLKIGGEEVLPIGYAVKLIEAYAKEREKKVRHAAAEITLTIGGERDLDEAHRDIMNL